MSNEAESGQPAVWPPGKPIFPATLAAWTAATLGCVSVLGWVDFMAARTLNASSSSERRREWIRLAFGWWPYAVYGLLGICIVAMSFELAGIARPLFRKLWHAVNTNDPAGSAPATSTRPVDTRSAYVDPDADADVPGADPVLLERARRQSPRTSPPHNTSLAAPAVSSKEVVAHILDPKSGYSIQKWQIGEDIKEETVRKLGDDEGVYVVVAYNSGKPQRAACTRKAWEEARAQFDAIDRPGANSDRNHD